MLDLIVVVGLGVAIYYAWKYFKAYKVYIIGAIVIFGVYKLIGIKGMLIAGVLWFIYAMYTSHQYTQKFRRWSKQMSATHNYTSMIVRTNLEIMAQSFRLSQEELPYGRATGFLQSFKDDALTKADVDFYGYSPVRSKISNEFLEYGSLLSTYGILHKNQIKQGTKENDYRTEFIKLPFKGLWGVSYDTEGQTFTFAYPDETKEVILNISDPEKLVRALTNLISLGYTNDLYTGWVEKQSNDEIQQNMVMTQNATVGQVTRDENQKVLPSESNPNSVGPQLSQTEVENELDERFDDQKKKTDIDKTQRAGVLGGTAVNVGAHVKDIQLNQMVSGTKGHGVAAEYANNLNDKIKNPLKSVRQLGQNNAKNGPDRMVGAQNIQTKYYQSASGSVNAGFGSNGMYKYVNANGSPMQLEVPKDQYAEALTKMKRKIADGKVSGISDPEQAKNIIRRGSVSYKDSLAIAKGGNVKSIYADLRDGAVQSLAAGGVSFVIIFAQAKWSGKDTSEAAKLAGAAGLKTVAMGAVVSAGSQQFAKIATRRLAEDAGKKVAAEQLASRASFAISLAITLGPGAFDALSGRISLKQFTKDALVAGGGVAGGAAAGAAMGSVVPGVGNLVGAVVGGAVASIAAKKALDHFMEDDAIEMFAELKEEFMDTAFATSINGAEFDRLQATIFDEKVGSKLKDMFASDNPRHYARDTIVGDTLSSIIGERPVVNNEEILEAYETAQNEFTVASI